MRSIGKSETGSLSPFLISDGSDQPIWPVEFGSIEVLSDISKEIQNKNEEEKENVGVESVDVTQEIDFEWTEPSSPKRRRIDFDSVTPTTTSPSSPTPRQSTPGRIQRQGTFQLNPFQSRLAFDDFYVSSPRFSLVQILSLLFLT